MGVCGLQLVYGPAALPIHLDEAKAWLKMDSISDDDDLISEIIASAAAFAETQLSERFVCQTWRASWDCFPDEGEPLYLPLSPAVGVTGITYVDTDGTTQTWSASNYQVDVSRRFARVIPAYGVVWPVAREQLAAVQVTFRVGFAAKITAVAATDVLTISGRTVTDGDVVRVRNSGGGLPGGLAAITDYFVRDTSGQTFKLAATSGGSAIDLTSAGTGTHFLGEIPADVRQLLRWLVNHQYAERSPVVISGAIPKELPLAVEAILINHGSGLYC